MPYPDRAPTREEKRGAIAVGILAAKNGREFMDCPWKSTGGPFERELRSCWVQGFNDCHAERLGDRLFR